LYTSLSCSYTFILNITNPWGKSSQAVKWCSIQKPKSYEIEGGSHQGNGYKIFLMVTVHIHYIKITAYCRL